MTPTAPSEDVHGRSWQTGPSQAGVDSLLQTYRRYVAETLQPIVRLHYLALKSETEAEYRKMLELSTKMMVVGHACTEIAGYDYDQRRQRIACLFGACCFLADSFLDDFGEAATHSYLQRLELLLTRGWFEVRTDRERLFYVIVSRLFAERDILQPTLRQAILRLFEAQRRDVEMRALGSGTAELRRTARLALLKRCARDRSGHAIIVLTAFLVPSPPLDRLRMIFIAGALIMFIDDHGDCFADRASRRVTYMNQLARPAAALRHIFTTHVAQLTRGLPAAQGRDLLIAFLSRYYVTRLNKHRQQRRQGASAWAVYE
jgi:hypothetical protein